MCVWGAGGGGGVGCRDEKVRRQREGRPDAFFPPLREIKKKKIIFPFRRQKKKKKKTLKTSRNSSQGKCKYPHKPGPHTKRKSVFFPMLPDT